MPLLLPTRLLFSACSNTLRSASSTPYFSIQVSRIVRPYIGLAAPSIGGGGPCGGIFPRLCFDHSLRVAVLGFRPVAAALILSLVACEWCLPRCCLPILARVDSVIGGRVLAPQLPHTDFLFSAASLFAAYL